MGTKKEPLHALVSHGSVRVRGPPPPALDLRGLSSWFQESSEGRVEGIVWHCDDGTLVKVSGRRTYCMFSLQMFVMCSLVQRSAFDFIFILIYIRVLILLVWFSHLYLSCVSFSSPLRCCDA